MRPTIIVTTNPMYRTMCDELFDPALTLHVQTGSILNLLRWNNPRTIKETFAPAARLPLSVHG